jgi:hypothetical protein
MSLSDELLVSRGLDPSQFTSVFASQLEHVVMLGLANPFSLLDEVRALEGLGPTRTKEPAPFKGDVLRGIMHKHFFSARHIAHNLRNVWADPDKLQRVLNRELASPGENHDPWERAGRVAKRLTVTAFEHKEKGQALTGDWIVYRRHHDRNYYLCLAVHGEPDAMIFERFVDAAAREFPQIGIRRRNV